MPPAAAWVLYAVALLTTARLLLLAAAATAHRRRTETQASPQPLPRVSAVIPAHDEQATIASCVRALLDGGCTDIEVVLVDDGSTYDTAAAAGTVADPRVRVVTQTNQGKPAALDAGCSIWQAPARPSPEPSGPFRRSALACCGGISRHPRRGHRHRHGPVPGRLARRLPQRRTRPYPCTHDHPGPLAPALPVGLRHPAVHLETPAGNQGDRYRGPPRLPHLSLPAAVSARPAPCRTPGGRRRPLRARLRDHARPGVHLGPLQPRPTRPRRLRSAHGQREPAPPVARPAPADHLPHGPVPGHHPRPGRRSTRGKPPVAEPLANPCGSTRKYKATQQRCERPFRGSRTFLVRWLLCGRLDQEWGPRGSGHTVDDPLVVSSDRVVTSTSVRRGPHWAPADGGHHPGRSAHGGAVRRNLGAPGRTGGHGSSP